MHQNVLFHGLYGLALTRKTLKCARMTAKRLAPTWGAAELDDRLGPSASWGSWCNRGQTHQSPHVDGAGTRARLCIYLMALQAGFRLSSCLAEMWVEPSGGSKWMAMTALAEKAVVVDVAQKKERSGAVECEFRLWSALEAAIAVEDGGLT